MSLLEELVNIKDSVRFLILEGPSKWNSLDIVYEQPHIERLWRQIGEHRLYLHKIYPCHSPFLHPHIWPSAIYGLRGIQEMAIAAPIGPVSDPEDVDIIARFLIHPGSAYEMLNPYGWHFVNPVDEPSLSIMLTGFPFEKPVYDHATFGKGLRHEELSPTRKNGLLVEFDRALMPSSQWKPVA